MADAVTQLQQAYPTVVPGTEGSGTSNTTEVPLGSKPGSLGNYLGVEKPVFEKRGELAGKMEANAQQEGENKVARAQLGEEQAGAEGDVAVNAQADLLAQQDQNTAALQKEVERLRPALDAVDKFQFHDHWSDGHTGQAVLAAVASGLLGFGTGQYHNVAKEIADADHARQIAQFNGILERARMMGGNVDRLLQIQKEAGVMQSAMLAAKYTAIAKQYQRLGAQATTAEQRQAAEAGVLLMQNAANEKKAEALRTLRRHVGATSTRTTKAPEAQKP